MRIRSSSRLEKQNEEYLPPAERPSPAFASWNLVKCPELSGSKGGIFFKLLGKGEAVRISRPGCDLLDRERVVKKELLCHVQSFLDQISVWRHVKFLAEQLAEILIADPEIFRHYLLMSP